MRFVAAVLLAAFPVAAAAQDAKPSPQEEALKKLAADFPRLIKAADADSNGKLSVVEYRVFAPSVRRAGEAILGKLDPAVARKRQEKALKKYDANSNGTLDEDEQKKMDEENRLREIKPFDWDHDGKLSEREKTAMQWAAEGQLAYRHRKYDTDASGQLSAEEIMAALGSISGIKVKKSKP